MSGFDFKIGAVVHCPDGRCGRLLKVVVDPETREVTDLIVEKGFLLSEDRVLPADAVEEAAADEIHVSVASHELEEFERYDEDVVEVPAPGYLSGRRGGAVDRAHYAVWLAYDQGRGLQGGEASRERHRAGRGGGRAQDRGEKRPGLHRPG
jgi:hypothetical protein